MQMGSQVIVNTALLLSISRVSEAAKDWEIWFHRHARELFWELELVLNPHETYIKVEKNLFIDI